MNRPHYQVLCTWGLSGVASLGIAPDIYIWVDSLSESSENVPETDELAGSGRVLLSSLTDAFAVADWVADLQIELQQRLCVLVVCAGAETHNIADQLAAGAVIERLAQRGLDAMSPEAAVANAAFVQLRNATSHLISASEAWTNSTASHVALTVDESIKTDQVRILR